MSTFPEQRRPLPASYEGWMNRLRPACDVLPNYPIRDITVRGVNTPRIYRDEPGDGTLTINITNDINGEPIVRARASWHFMGLTRSYFIANRENPQTGEDFRIAVAETRIPALSLGALACWPSEAMRLKQTEVITPYRYAEPHEYLELQGLLENTAHKVNLDNYGDGLI